MDMRNRCWGIGLVLAVLCAGHTAVQTQAQAPCGPGTICADYDAADYVFYARVAQVTPSLDDRTVGPLLNQTVMFEVIEDFKATAGSGATLMVNPTVPDARLFTPGETVLVYARRVDRTLVFAGCTRTRRVRPDEPEFTTLRQLQLDSRGSSLEGALQISTNARPPALPRSADLGNVQISLQAMDGSDTIVVRTEPSGYFLFPWLKPGAYRLRVEAPALAPAVRDIVIGDKGRCQSIDGLFARPG
jgi:hypothetical protein